MERYGGRRKELLEIQKQEKRQHSENQFVCSRVGWHWLRHSFLPWPYCQSLQTEECTPVYTYTHILGLSRARVRFSPNYTNCLSSKQPALAASWDTERGSTCRSEKEVWPWNEGGGVTKGGREQMKGGVDDFKQSGGNSAVLSWIFSNSPPSPTSLSVP